MKNPKNRKAASGFKQNLLRHLALRNYVLAMGLAICLSGCATHDPELGLNRTPYDHPLTSPGSEFAALPPAAQNTIRSQTGAAEIRRILTYKPGAENIYKIEFREEDTYPPLLLGHDGSILNPDLSIAVGAPANAGSGGVIKGGVATGLALADLPAAASATILQRAPAAQVSAVERETWGDRIIYVVSFKDEVKYPKLYVATDGTILKEGHN